jgi:hypothetical protein
VGFPVKREDAVRGFRGSHVGLLDGRVPTGAGRICASRSSWTSLTNWELLNGYAMPLLSASSILIARDYALRYLAVKRNL